MAAWREAAQTLASGNLAEQWAMLVLVQVSPDS